MPPALGVLVLSLTLLGARPAAAFTVQMDSSALEFHGFRAGATLDELAAVARGFDAGRLRCERAKADRRVSECRAVLTHPELGGSVNLWVSAIDSVAGIITLSSGVSAEQLEKWREAVERRYGKVSARAQGTQWMMQWVRRGRMLRLTWRLERGQKVASVSLVDGNVLDAWGQSRAAAGRS